MQDPMDRERDELQRAGKSEKSPGKIATFALAGMIGVALLAAFAVAIGQKDTGQGEPEMLAFADPPTAGRIDECNQYAAQVVREGGAAGSGAAVSDDDPNLVGLSDENRYSNVARTAYRDCMLGIQHDS